MNQLLFKKHSSHYEKCVCDFRYERKPSCATAKLTLFNVSKDEWDAKEDTGMPKKNALYVHTAICQKAPRDVEQ